jgi:hypothetical protein
MALKAFFMLMVSLVYTSQVSCRFWTDFRTDRKETADNVMIKNFVKILVNKIQTDSLTDDDVSAIAYVMRELVKKRDALFKTPPVYWYSRKG